MNSFNPHWILPDWPAPANVRALVTTRQGGVSKDAFASFNLGAHVGDAPAAVAHNRALLRALLPADPLWLEQVHGIDAIDGNSGPVPITSSATPPVADAVIAREPARNSGYVCAILTADCLPVLLCDRAGTAVAAVHAGWRGLASGIIETTVRRLGIPGEQLMGWLGPAIGPEAFEVGPEVRSAFLAHDPEADKAFQAHKNDNGAKTEKWHADLYLLARQRLAALGITAVAGGGFCTLRDNERFFSYRRDGVTGRMASLIWLQDIS